MRQKLRNLYADNLFRNSFFLMLNAGVQAALGFVFWLIAAHLFTPDDVGVAASLISAMSLISYLSLLGFNSTFVRILPASKNRSNEINTGLLLSISATVIVAIGYVLLVPFIAPRLSIIHENIFYAAGFVFLVAFAAINILTDSIFIAFRGAAYNLIIDGGIQGTIKILLPFVFVGLGAYGLFAASGSAAAAAMIASILFLVWKFDYKPAFRIHWQTLKNVFHYSLSNYLGNLFNIAPTLILPIIVIDHLGAAEAGYYYVAFTVASLLYAVVYSVAQSLFAEGSYDEGNLSKLLKRSSAIIIAIMIPSAIVLAFFGTYVLRAFGASYSVGGSKAILVFAIGSPAVVLYTICSVLLRIKNKIYSIVIMNIVYFVTISGLALLWVNRGLDWTAWAWVIGNLVAAAAALIALAPPSKK